MTGTKAAPHSHPATHLIGDPSRRLPRSRCGIDLSQHVGLPVTDDLSAVTCSSCLRLHVRYG